MPRDGVNDIDPDELLMAYRLGYFPMARSRESADVVWVLPEKRGVLQLKDARCPRRLRRFIARAPFTIKINAAFRDVMLACAAPAPGRRETWINDAIIDVYTELHRRGAAHSVECWKDGVLVGGVYGVALGGLFCGESMFSRVDNASKTALIHLIGRLKLNGFTLLDAQFPSDHLEQFGVIEITNMEYQDLLAEALKLQGTFTDGSAGSDGLANSSTMTVLQSITQTS